MRCERGISHCLGTVDFYHLVWCHVYCSERRNFNIWFLNKIYKRRIVQRNVLNIIYHTMSKNLKSDSLISALYGTGSRNRYQVPVALNSTHSSKVSLNSFPRHNIQLKKIIFDQSVCDERLIDDDCLLKQQMHSRCPSVVDGIITSLILLEWLFETFVKG